MAHKDVQSFLQAAGPLLLRDEARHNLILGICSTLVDAPDAHPVVHLWTAEHAEKTVWAAVMTPPFNLVVAQPLVQAALQFAVKTLATRRVILPGVTGAVPEVDEFAASWEGATGVSRRLRMAHGIYAARSARIPTAVQGELRLASDEDRHLLIDWITAFHAEALPDGAPRQAAEETVDQLLRSSGGVALWEDGEVVSLSGFGRFTRHGVRIGPVYTPPRSRQHGYASALVAHLTRRLLDGGREFCFLYTDLANPTSNRIYRDVGYQLACESAEYAFEQRA